MNDFKAFNVWLLRFVAGALLLGVTGWATYVTTHLTTTAEAAEEAKLKAAALETYRDDARQRFDRIDRNLERINERLDKLQPQVIYRYRTVKPEPPISKYGTHDPE